MKYVSSISIILAFSFLGELLHALLPLPVPSSIYGLVLLFASLCLKIVKLDAVKDVGHWGINIMALMFVCPTVGLLAYQEIMLNHWFSLFVIVVVSLLLTFLVAGKITQFIIEKEYNGNDT